MNATPSVPPPLVRQCLPITLMRTTKPLPPRDSWEVGALTAEAAPAEGGEMSKPHLYIVLGAEQDDDFMEAVVAEAARIDLFAQVKKIVKPEQTPPSLPGSNVISFAAYADSLPVFVPYDDNGRMMEEQFWVTLDKSGQPRKKR